MKWMLQGVEGRVEGREEGVEGRVEGREEGGGKWVEWRVEEVRERRRFVGKEGYSKASFYGLTSVPKLFCENVELEK